MFRHFSQDPTPARIMRERAPAVNAWVARLWNARYPQEKGEWPPAGSLPPGWDDLLHEVGETHLVSLHANAVAWREGRSHFDLEVQGTRYRRLPTVQYRAWCRERLQDHFESLPETAKPEVRGRLERQSAWEPLWRDGRIASRLHPGGDPPRCRAPRRRDAARILGSPWNPTPAGQV
jgi:hypothetical protein